MASQLSSKHSTRQKIVEATVRSEKTLLPTPGNGGSPSPDSQVTVPPLVQKIIEKRNIADLKPHPQQNTFFPLKDIEKFAETLERGLENPVEITPDNIIICGHRRTAAAKFLGWETIDCWIRHDLAEQGEVAIELRFLRDNADRQHLDKLGIARAYQRERELLDQGLSAGRRQEQPRGDTRDEIGRRLGVAGRTLDRYLNILRTPLVVQQAFQRNELPLLTAEKVAHLGKKVQDQIEREINGGGNATTVVDKHLQEDAQRRAGWAVNRQVIRGKFFKCLGRLDQDVAEFEAHPEFLPELSPKAVETINKASALFSRLLAEHDQAIADKDVKS
jgi:ParB-like chromosome segregation protein Spo0J